MDWLLVGVEILAEKHKFMKTIFTLANMFAITIFVQVRHFGVSELCCDIGIPEQPLEDEHSQTQHVAVALERDQLTVDRLKMKNNDEETIYSKRQKQQKTYRSVRIPPAQFVATVDCMKEASRGLSCVHLEDDDKARIGHFQLC